MNLKILEELNQPIFYVTNDVGRGIGLENLLPNYHIICLDDHPLVDILQSAGISVFCLERSLGKRNFLLRNAGTILSQPETIRFIKEKSRGARPNILFFKPQKKIEVISQKYGFKLLGNLVETNHAFEDKVDFFSLCQKEGIGVPPGEIVNLSAINFSEAVLKYGYGFVIQFGRGWAGNSTFFVNEEEELKKLQKDFGQLRVKLCRFIKGITLLNNAVICQEEVLISEPALQIKAHKTLTAARGGTGGRQWPAPLPKRKKEEIIRITRQVGNLMKKRGYQGFFGLDFLLAEDGEIFLSENNARLTASVPFFTKLELRVGSFPLLGFHLLAFFSKKIKSDFSYEAPILTGSEIVLRNTSKIRKEVSGEVKTGIYELSFRFKKEGYSLNTDILSDFWLEPAACGRIVNPEIELAKIDTLALVSDEKGNLQEKYLNLVEKISENLRLKSC